MHDGMNETDPTRRELLRAGTLMLAGMAAPLVVRPAAATPEEMKAEIAKVVEEARITPGRVTLEIPPLVENGNTVPCAVTVDSPMTPSDYVKAIHVFAEKNPQPNVISCHVGPRAGRASIATRIRLADTQKVVAIAELSDGSFWSDTAEVIVTIGACLEDNVI
jgi:sulfur-oxidizing protein SoxY